MWRGDCRRSGNRRSGNTWTTRHDRIPVRTLPVSLLLAGSLAANTFESVRVGKGVYALAQAHAFLPNQDFLVFQAGKS